MSKKNKSKDNKKRKINSEDKAPQSTLPFGKYNELFVLLKKGEKKNLIDPDSEARSYMPIVVVDENVYLTSPDKDLIPTIDNQKKCDFLIYCQNKPQSCFIELKGTNITIKKNENPYDQIMATINYLQGDKDLKVLVNSQTEKHAFIVSPDRQKIPKGSETKERQLWQVLARFRSERTEIPDLVHYVKVTPSERYSNNNGQIICSPNSPVPLPYSP